VALKKLLNGISVGSSVCVAVIHTDTVLNGTYFFIPVLTESNFAMYHHTRGFYKSLESEWFLLFSLLA
jgi:hypothetical protein